SKVGVMGVGALHADSTLAVDRGGRLQGADDSGPGCSSRGDDGPEAPHGRLPVDAVVAVLALEEAAPEILSIAVLREAQALVVHGVDNEGIRCEAGDVLNRGHGAVDRLRVVLGAGSIELASGLDTGPVQQTKNLRAGAGPIEQLVLLGESEQVQPALVDLGNEEGCILEHLIGDLQKAGDLFESVGPHGRISNVELGLGPTFRDGREVAFDRPFDQIRDGVGVRPHGPGPEEVRDDRPAESPDNSPVIFREPRSQVPTWGRLRVVVGLDVFRSRDGRTADGLHSFEPVHTDVLNEVFTQALCPGCTGVLGRWGAERGEPIQDRLIGRCGLDLCFELVSLGQVAVDFRSLVIGETAALSLYPLRDVTGGFESGFALCFDGHAMRLSLEWILPPGLRPRTGLRSAPPTWPRRAPRRWPCGPRWLPSPGLLPRPRRSRGLWPPALRAVSQCASPPAPVQPSERLRQS